jgi:predicted YcjX-like family ATPase
MGDGNRTPVDEMLVALTKWCVGVDAIWAQGSTFDIPIMENLFQQYERHVPWPFWKIRDARTLMQIMPIDPRKAMNFEAHNALEDCKVQALCVQQVLQQLELTVK